MVTRAILTCVSTVVECRPCAASIEFQCTIVIVLYSIQVYVTRPCCGAAAKQGACKLKSPSTLSSCIAYIGTWLHERHKSGNLTLQLYHSNASCDIELLLYAYLYIIRSAALCVCVILRDKNEQRTCIHTRVYKIVIFHTYYVDRDER